ncbi:Cellulose synthase-like protein E6, partial [Mucuna pruriens]
MARFSYHVETVQSWLALSRLHILLHLVAVLSICYYRISHFIFSAPWLLMTIAELLLAVLWFFNQAFRWRPVSRTVMPEKLPGGDNLPGLDIFVCTLDPDKEPTGEVMDTIVSAISMDYPANKLAVYLSDDGGCAVTLYGIREAAQFAKEWVPFCTKYGIKSRCPKVFFSPMYEDQHILRDDGFLSHRQLIKVFIHFHSFFLPHFFHLYCLISNTQYIGKSHNPYFNIWNPRFIYLLFASPILKSQVQDKTT